MTIKKESACDVRLIKKYPGRRLYDTHESKYIAFEGVKKLIQEDVRLQIIDIKTGLDLTRNILLQIIVNQEEGLSPLFKTETLKSIIKFYGNSMQVVMTDQLEKSIEAVFSIQSMAAENAEYLIDDYFDKFKAISK
jgi:polyhydroxyalkanoate synthesis repressor PhaR